jgi:hypothetical protein
MKCQRVFLARWLADYTDSYVDIPWPEVHRQSNSAVINWINQQDPTVCQMIMDREENGSQRSLWAEFYQPRTYTEYLLRFAQ